jgi:type III restriction enzyme
VFSAVRVNGEQVIVLEMKGEHLSGNPDTEYKKHLLNLLTSEYRFEGATVAGSVEIVQEGGITVQCALVLFPEWRNKLPSIIHADSDAEAGSKTA